MKRSRINNISQKRKDEGQEYKRLHGLFMAANPRCQCKPDGVEQCSQMATEVHHRMGRGKYYLTVATWMSVCSTCHHDRIHKNGTWARQFGYLINPASILPCLPLHCYPLED